MVLETLLFSSHEKEMEHKHQLLLTPIVGIIVDGVPSWK